MIIKSSIPFFLRAYCIVIKFIFSVTIISAGEVSLLGQTSLLLAIVNFTIYLVGLELYYFVDRNALVNGLKNSLMAKLICALIITFALVVMAFFMSFVWGWHFAYSSYVLFTMPVIFAMEIISQEAYRLIVISGGIIYSNFIVFCRTAILPTFVIIFDIFKLDFFVNIWLYCAIFSSIVSIIGLLYFDSVEFSIVKIVAIVFDCKNKMKLIAVIYFANIWHRSIYAIDKVVISIFSSTDVLGVYTFYLSIITAVTSLLDSSVISKNLSKYIRDKSLEYREVFFKTIFYYVVIGVFVILSYFMVTSDFFVNKLPSPLYVKIKSFEEITTFKDIFICLISAFFIYIFQDLKNFAYSRKLDIIILHVNIAIPFVFFLSLILFVRELEAISVIAYAISYFMAYCFVFFKVLKYG